MSVSSGYIYIVSHTLQGPTIYVLAFPSKNVILTLNNIQGRRTMSAEVLDAVSAISMREATCNA